MCQSMKGRIDAAKTYEYLEPDHGFALHRHPPLPVRSKMCIFPRRLLLIQPPCMRLPALWPFVQWYQCNHELPCMLRGS
jgi:hypothetical protein